MIDYTTPDGRFWYISRPFSQPGKRRPAQRMYGWGLGYVGTFSNARNARRSANRLALRREVVEQIS